MLPDLQVWLAHFEYHAGRHRHVPDGIEDRLVPAARQLIARSVAVFELGERSDGEALRRAALEYERRHRVAPLARIIDLQLREVRCHADLLRGFMDDHGIAPRASDWTERVFRRLRRLAGLETALSVLVTAELAGIVYYRALERATDNRRLQVLCRMIVADQLAHVAFGADLLLGLRASRRAPARVAANLAHRGLNAATALVVWLTHGAVLRRAGLGRRAFLRTCAAQFSFYLCTPVHIAEIPPSSLSSEPVMNRLSSEAR